jgi:hypothetical protein
MRIANALLVLVLSVAGCSSVDQVNQRLSPAEGRALAGRLLPQGVQDRNGWATDIYAAFSALEIEPKPDNICAVVAIIGQESGFQADPAVPGLADIAHREILKRAEDAGIPSLAVEAALTIPSSDGRTYADRLRAARTERQLSELYEEIIGRVPFGKKLLAGHNPVRTGGPMQVSVAFAESQVNSKPYPYPIRQNIRSEVFSRRGGLYFGIAHLLDYSAPYSGYLHRFADFNAGRYASRNAAFQAAVSALSGIPLELDGDLLSGTRDEPGATERAARIVGRRLDLSDNSIHTDLELEKSPRFEATRLYRAVFELAERQGGKSAPRALVPRITLKSPKITRNLTTAWFADRAQARYESCIRVGR